MALSDDDTRQKNGAAQNRAQKDDVALNDNVVRLGTETLFAIGEELRRMYEADLRSKPSEELERLVRQIERGEDVTEPVRGVPRPPAGSPSDDAAS
jgi:hypothetical protein